MTSDVKSNALTVRGQAEQNYQSENSRMTATKKSSTSSMRAAAVASSEEHYASSLTAEDQEVAGIFGEEIEIEKPKLFRQNTFTKDSAVNASEIAAASVHTAAAAYGQQQESSSSFAAQATASKSWRQNNGSIKLIGGKVVKQNVDSQDSVDYKDLRASVQRPTDNIQVGGSFDYAQSKQDKRSTFQATQSSLELAQAAISAVSASKTSIGGKQRAVRKRTWTKEEAQELALAQQAARVEMVKHEDNLQILEGKFEGRQVEEWHKGERAAIVKYPDNIKLEGDVIRREKEPFIGGERAKPFKHNDNLHPEGNMDRNKKEWATKGERSEVVRHDDNLKM
jgi:hypothetical protein